MIKRFIKGYLPGFLTGIIVFSSFSVIAMTYFPSSDVTYDNSESEIESTNVQGAIDELYETCTAVPSIGEQIIENGNLKKDQYECRYFFTGANPNNYITFNNEVAGWRIISAECDGTIKIMKINNIGNNYWDTGSGSAGANNWERPASLNTYLNQTYLNSTLNSTSRNQIVSHDFSIGTVTYNNNDLSGQVNNENSKKWNGKVAIPTVSEYIRSNSNKSCGTFSLYNTNYNTCKNSTWMYINNSFWWTLSPHSNGVFVISNQISTNMFLDISSAGVYPTVYLSSEVQITGGTGTMADPYTIAN